MTAPSWEWGHAGRPTVPSTDAAHDEMRARLTDERATRIDALADLTADIVRTDAGRQYLMLALTRANVGPVPDDVRRLTCALVNGGRL